MILHDLKGLERVNGTLREKLQLAHHTIESLRIREVDFETLFESMASIVNDRESAAEPGWIESVEAAEARIEALTGRLSIEQNHLERIKASRLLMIKSSPEYGMY